MIDTIKFKIPLMLSLKEIENIKWTKVDIIRNLKLNTTKKYLKYFDEEWVGCPRLTYNHDESSTNKSYLTVEVSLPKLRHGTNFYELSNSELEWTFKVLRLYLCKQLAIPLKRLLSIDRWEIKKLHLCKNFYVGSDEQKFLTVASNTQLPRHKTKIYKEKGNGSIQSVEWMAKSRKEKLYIKKAEVLENKRHHEDIEEIMPFLNGVIRYEIELSTAEIKKYKGSLSVSEFLKEDYLLELINTYLQRLNISTGLVDNNLSRIIQYIESLDLSTNTKSSLIAFAAKQIELGNESKSTYSESGYKKVKSQYFKLVESEMKTLQNNQSRVLMAQKFDFTKFTNKKRTFQCYN